MTFHCFFEQSGTFKKEFIRLGHEAFDYDIKNDFGETDYVLDLFEEIKCAFRGEGSIFDRFGSGDTILAFFPCVRFSTRASLLVRALSRTDIDKSEEERLKISMKYERERSLLYELLCKLCIVCIQRKIALVIENPYHSDGYLARYFPVKAKIIDTNRMDTGDWFPKPTQYFFFNREPSENFIFEARVLHPKRKVETCSVRQRSMIAPEYANRFIREFIL